MRTKTLSASEYAKLYGCTPQYVTRKLNENTGLTGMVSWRKIEGRTGSWIIQVLKSWVDANSKCDVCGSSNVKVYPAMGLNCEDCNPVKTEK